MAREMPGCGVRGAFMMMPTFMHIIENYLLHVTAGLYMRVCLRTAISVALDEVSTGIVFRWTTNPIETRVMK